MHFLSREPHTQQYKLQLVLKGQKQNYKEEIKKSPVSENFAWDPRANIKLWGQGTQISMVFVTMVIQIQRNVYKTPQIKRYYTNSNKMSAQHFEISKHFLIIVKLLLKIF